MIILMASAPDLSTTGGYTPAPYFRRAVYADGDPPPTFDKVGTGGLEDIDYVIRRHGYRPYELLISKAKPESTNAYTQLMADVKQGFGRTMKHLPAVFGVSRQTLYNWLAGETPREQHRAKLIELAAAARVFQENGITPTVQMLIRPVSNGRSLLELIGDGAKGQETTEKLIRIVRRGDAATRRLDALVAGRPVHPESAATLERHVFPDNS